MIELSILGSMTAALTLYFIHRFRLPAERLGLIDEPGGRKDHQQSTPLVGGLAMFVAFCFAALLLSSSLKPFRPFFAGMGLLVITGLLDDLHDLGAREKFGLQTAAAVVMVFWGGLVIEDLGVLPLVGFVDLAWLAIPFTLVCAVGLVNAVNMMDGVDGLAGGVVLAALFWLAVIGFVSAEQAGSATALLVLLACAVAAFLFFNFPHPWRTRASVFMGDSGSTMLGFALGWFAIELAFEHGSSVPPVTIAWVLGLPVFDTIALMLRRVMKGQSPMMADREHLHHVFQRAGFSARGTVYVVAGTAFVFGAVGVIGWLAGVPESLLWVALLVVFVLHFWFVQHAWRAMRFLRWLRH